MLRFDGRKSAERRRAAERGEAIATPHPDGSMTAAVGFEPYVKTSLTYAVRIREPFEVETLEGLHFGKAGDYIAVGAHGEMYPIDAAVFEATYARPGS